MTDQPKRVLHLCGYCHRGAVDALPAKCPECGAELTVDIRENLTRREVEQWAKVKPEVD